MKKLFCVDGNAYLHRVWFTLKTNRPVSDALAYSFLSLVCKDALRVGASHLMVAFDGPKVFRFKTDSQYKSGRKDKKIKDKQNREDAGGESLQNIYEHLPAVRELLTTLGIAWVQPRTYEADDVLATMARLWLEGNESNKCVLGGVDKDLYQCLNSRVVMFDSSHKPEPRYIKVKDAEVRKGVPIEKMIDYQTLLGDATDSIPGFKGYGPAKVKSILATYKSIKNWSVEGSAEDKAWLAKNKVRIITNRKLVTLVNNCIEVVDLDRLVVPKYLSKSNNLPKTWHDYINFLYPKTKSLFS